MRNIIVAIGATCAFLFCTNRAVCQIPDKLLYIVDSMPYFDEPVYYDTELNKEDIAEYREITSRTEIDKLGYPTCAKIIMISTKEYATRSDSIKKIISTNLLTLIKKKYYDKETHQPYTGYFIDYYLSGRKKVEGYLKEGTPDGRLLNYHSNGVVYTEYNYMAGKLTGEYKEHHKNGSISLIGQFDNNKQVGCWKGFFSTSILEDSVIFIKGKLKQTKEAKKTTRLLNDALSGLNSHRNNNDNVEALKTTIRKMNKAIELDTNILDAYYYRGRAKLLLLDFNGALLDFDKAIEMEPLFNEVYAYRAFSRIKKYELPSTNIVPYDSLLVNQLNGNHFSIPEDELNLICADLSRVDEHEAELSFISYDVREAKKKYCIKK
jgi:antitoxin component YwqK of YwqJK toxin-antitoxin module